MSAPVMRHVMTLPAGFRPEAVVWHACGVVGEPPWLVYRVGVDGRVDVPEDFASVPDVDVREAVRVDYHYPPRVVAS